MREDIIKMVILTIEYLIIMEMAMNLIINPIKGGIPPKDIKEIIILILFKLEIFDFIKSKIELILFFWIILTIAMIIIK